jgi:F420-non-reducing hydrogenase small subunit
MSEKPKVAFYWCASCGGCEEAVVDLAEGILDVVAALDIVFWPVALDFKRSDVEAKEDGEILVSFINGAVRTSEQEEMVHLLRKKSQLVIAFGSCSHLGGIPGLANLWDKETIFKKSYVETPSTVNPEKTYPQQKLNDEGREVTLPGFDDTVRALNQVVDVDYYIPGCAPTPKILQSAVQTLLSDELPPKGAVIASEKALCDECSRKESRPEKLVLSEFKRPHEILIQEEKCLLAQGLLGLGPAARGGCEALCIEGNMPCSGCFGPTGHVRDYGGKALSAFVSLIESTKEDEILNILSSIPDPIGTLYRYSLPTSLLRRAKVATQESQEGN